MQVQNSEFTLYFFRGLVEGLVRPRDEQNFNHYVQIGGYLRTERGLRKFVKEDMESDIFVDFAAAKGRSPSWLKFAVLTAASALVGGIATAWWYRKTLAKLRETGEIVKNPHFGMPAERSEDNEQDGA